MTVHTTRELSFQRNKMCAPAAQMKQNSMSAIKFKALRIPFTEDEDAKLKQIVGIFGEDCWRIVSLNMPGRSAKQCKDRYFNSLAPNLENGEWTSEEENLLREKVDTLGTRWSIIAKFFKNRGPNNIKNHWNRVLSKKNTVSKEANVQQPLVYKEIDEFNFLDPINYEFEDWATMIDTL
jgi:hypothetical protein